MFRDEVRIEVDATPSGLTILEGSANRHGANSWVQRIEQPSVALATPASPPTRWPAAVG